MTPKGRMISVSKEKPTASNQDLCKCGGEILFKVGIGADFEGKGGFWIYQCSACKDMIVRDE